MRKPLTMEQHYAERKIQQNKSYSRAKEPCLGVAEKMLIAPRSPIIEVLITTMRNMDFVI